MLARLGHVVGWIGDLLGALFIVGGLAQYFKCISGSTPKDHSDRPCMTQSASSRN